MSRVLSGTVSALLGLALAACGGSSSETPPPLEPLPVNLHYDRSSTALAADQIHLAPDAGSDDEASEETRATGRPARPTWGGEKAPGLRDIK